MDVYEAIKERRSIRSYRSDPVPQDALDRVLDAFRSAPSAANKQPWKVIVVRDPATKEKVMAASSYQTFLTEAPCLIVACGLPNAGRIGGHTTSTFVDVAIAMDHLTLAAHAEGLGTCWIGAFHEEDVKEILNIPQAVRVVAISPLGYPAVKGGPFRRKELSEIVCYDEWKE